MNTATLPSLTRAWVLLGLLAAASTAQAQSAEFRRGYDQGYRDGVAAAQSGQVQAPLPPYPPQVRIEVARYGVGRSTCDARDALQQRLANPQQGYQIRVDNGLCGDPAPGQVKQLVVRYRCVDEGGGQRMVVPENGVLSFNCR